MSRTRQITSVGWRNQGDYHSDDSPNIAVLWYLRWLNKYEYLWCIPGYDQYIELFFFHFSTVSNFPLSVLPLAWKLDIFFHYVKSRILGYDNLAQEINFYKKIFGENEFNTLVRILRYRSTCQSWTVTLPQSPEIYHLRFCYETFMHK